MAYQTILVDVEDGVAVIALNRPDAMNALNAEMMGEVRDALAAYAADDSVACVVLTGSQKVFAAGADIKEIKDKTFIEMRRADFVGVWEAIARFEKPVIAAVSGYALGGGCEIAMMCDFILASDTAKFGQPEITLGVMPGAGGTQRLAHAVGKAKTMEMCLTGRMMDAEEAERAGLVSRILPKDDLLDAAKEAGRKIAGMSMPIAGMTKEAVNRAFETSLSEGIVFERRLFQAMFATEDQKEGMAAFVEKRKPSFKNK
ncbi:MAG: enoyl-CoA hydratase [Pseudomonadota bacterium]